MLVGLEAATAAAGLHGVRLLPPGPGGIAFTVEVPPPHLEELPGDPGWVRLVLDGYEDQGSPGLPALPVRIVNVAVPPQGDVFVTAAGRGEQAYEAVRLAPVPTLERGSPSEVPAYLALPDAYSDPGAMQSDRARLLGVSWMRNQRVARIAVTPADYEPARGRLIVFQWIDVSVGVRGAEDLGPPAESPDPFEDVYRGALVNYEQGRAWRRPASWRGRGLIETPSAESLVPSGAPSSSVFAGRSWIKIAISRTGFHRLERGQLQRFPLFSSDTTCVDSLRLFTWPGYPVLPERDFCDTCDYREVAIGIVDDGDRRFNRTSDRIYFFALGASDWADTYDRSRPDTVFINNPYDTRSYYYLTISTAENPVPGPFLRIGTESVARDGEGTTPATFRARVHHERDVPAEYFPDLTPGRSTFFWEKWFWRSLGMGGSFTSAVEAPGVDTTQAARLRMRLWGITSGGFCAAPAPPSHVVDLTINDTSIGRFGWNVNTGFSIDTLITGLRESGNSLRAEIPVFSNCSNRVDRIAVAWFDLHYARRFQPVGDALEFDTPVTGNHVFRISPFLRATPPRVFDITEPREPKEILEFAYETVDTVRRLSFQIGLNGRRRFRILPEDSIMGIPNANVSPAPVTSLTDLRSPTLRADYVVIYFDGFKVAADSLAAWRASHNGFETFTVPISALYDQFSGGRTDPAAMRNFLRAAFARWEKIPIYVTLLGDASYDFKNYKGLAGSGMPGTLVPSYENGFDELVLRQYATDDWILNVDPSNDTHGGVPDFLGGRIPATDAQSALDVVLNKVLLYERSAPLGEYRNRVMLIADDQEQGSSNDRLYWTHLRQTSELDNGDTPPHMDRVYVYLHTYADGPGDTKPGAKADIRRNINEGGVALFNFIGHGSPFQISDERVFLDTDVGTLTNATRLPLFVAASCDIGKYNDPTVHSLGERLVLRPGGGAIGVISATEQAFSGQNAALNRVIYREVFRRGSNGRYFVPAAQALLTGKSGAQNSQKYQLMGDAALRLNLPRLWVEITLLDSAGVEAVQSLEQGRLVEYRGRLLDRPGGSPVSVEGVASILIEDSAPLEQAPPCPLFPGCGVNCIPPAPPDCGQPFYVYRAGPIFRGDVGVRGGTFEGRFVVPLEAKRGARGRVRAYLSGHETGSSVQTDGVGNVVVSVVPGTGNPEDREGPRIGLSFAGGSTWVRPDALLLVNLFDPSGILITGHTRQNGIIVTVDENTTSREDITATFRYAADSHQSGTAVYRLPNLSPGRHTIRVSAADNLAVGLTAGEHRSSAIIEFEVRDVPPLTVERAYLFPNPARSRGGGGGGQFVVDAPGDSVNVLLRIYTVSGRLVRELRSLGGLGQVQIAWDGLDENGHELANGLYLYKVHVNPRDSDGSSSPSQKATAQGRFVIVNP